MLWPEQERTQSEVCRRYAACGACKVCKPDPIRNIRHKPVSLEETATLVKGALFVNLLIIFICYILTTYIKWLPDYAILLISVIKVETIYILLIPLVVSYYIVLGLNYIFAHISAHIFELMCGSKCTFNCIQDYLYDNASYLCTTMISILCMITLFVICHKIATTVLSWIEKIMTRNYYLIYIVAAIAISMWLFIIGSIVNF